MISILLRTLIYASLFIGFLLVFIPVELLGWAAIGRPETIGTAQVAGMILFAVGAAFSGWSALAFVRFGKGTPAPFDPPRRLVVRGPYRYLRNPMYLGAGVALGGAALFYLSYQILLYLLFLGIIVQLFIVYYEEPTLKRLFGAEYLEYCAKVGRWVS